MINVLVDPYKISSKRQCSGVSRLVGSLEIPPFNLESSQLHTNSSIL